MCPFISNFIEGGDHVMCNLVNGDISIFCFSLHIFFSSSEERRLEERENLLHISETEENLGLVTPGFEAWN